MDVHAITDAAREALEILRDGETFEWSTVTLLGLAVYVYAVEVERRRWDIVLAGLAFWLMDWFNELVNSAIFHATDRAPLWTVTGDTSFLILIGLNIEICLLFLIAGVVVRQVAAAAGPPAAAGDRLLDRVRGRRALPRVDRLLHLGVLVVEHRDVPGDRPVRLHDVLRDRRWSSTTWATTAGASCA